MEREEEGDDDNNGASLSITFKYLMGYNCASNNMTTHWITRQCTGLFDGGHKGYENNESDDQIITVH
ncbi:hypothetical protein AKJ16_DCAP14423 [Drosera capensis]